MYEMSVVPMVMWWFNGGERHQSLQLQTLFLSYPKDASVRSFDYLCMIYDMTEEWIASFGL